MAKAVRGIRAAIKSRKKVITKPKPLSTRAKASKKKTLSKLRAKKSPAARKK